MLYWEYLLPEHIVYRSDARKVSPLTLYIKYTEGITKPFVRLPLIMFILHLCLQNHLVEDQTLVRILQSVCHISTFSDTKCFIFHHCVPNEKVTPLHNHSLEVQIIFFQGVYSLAFYTMLSTRRSIVPRFLFSALSAMLDPQRMKRYARNSESPTDKAICSQ